MLTGFAIAKVCYRDNAKKDEIKSVKAARFRSSDGKKAEIYGSIASWSKGQIIDMITDESVQTKIFTLRNRDGEYELGAEVEVYEGKYIRMKGDNSEKDNLGDLPVYVSHS